jgi:hypothetical protein
MMRHERRGYNEAVKSWLWRGAMGSLLAFAIVALPALRAQADVTTIATSGNPVVWVRLSTGTITVHTWDRTDVSIDADPSIQLRHFTGPEVMKRYPQQIPLWSHSVITPGGVFTMPPETFVVPPPQSAVNDAVGVRGDGNVTIYVPANTSLVTANVNRGDVSIENFHNGVFISHVGSGSVRLENVTGTGALQVVNGPIHAIGSDFSRIRARTVRGNIVFERCNSKQIEATSIAGSVVYDNGTFEPGLARFESERGNVALGVAGGPVQINAHSDSGAVQSGFGNEARITRSGGEAQATVGSGGPIVTATSNGGAVLFYRGALRENAALRKNAPAARAMLQHWAPPRRVRP